MSLKTKTFLFKAKETSKLPLKSIWKPKRETWMNIEQGSSFNKEQNIEYMKKSTFGMEEIIRKNILKSDDVWTPTKCHYKWIGWNSRSRTINKIIFTKYLLNEYNTDIMIICETWLDKDPTWLDTIYEIFSTWNTKLQGVWIITKKNMANKSYCNDEPYLIEIELKQRGTFIIGVYMKENMKIISWSVRKTIKKNKMQVLKTEYSCLWRLQYKSKLELELIENSTNLTCQKLNKTHRTRSQKWLTKITNSTFDFFLTTTKETKIEVFSKSLSDHLPLMANFIFKEKSKISKIYSKQNKNRNEESKSTNRIKMAWWANNQQRKLI